MFPACTWCLNTYILVHSVTDQVYRHYYRYYRRRVAPKIDIRIVIIGAILGMSLCQVSYFSIPIPTCTMSECEVRAYIHVHSAHIYEHTLVHTHKHTIMYNVTHTHSHTHTHTHTQTNIHTNSLTHTHIHPHPHTHTQYIAWEHNFYKTLRAALHKPKYREQAIEIAKEKGIWIEHFSNLSKKEVKRMNKRDLRDELKAEQDAILLKIFRERVTLM